MAKRVSRNRNGGTWTEAQYFGAIRSALRSKFRWWRPSTEALNKSRRKYTGTNKLQRWEYCCAECGKWHLRKNVEIHHIVPCGSLNSYEDIAGFIQRLTPEKADAYAILCKACHIQITKEQRK